MHMWGAMSPGKTEDPQITWCSCGLLCVCVCVCVFRNLALGEYLWACLRSQAQILESPSEFYVHPTALEDPDR